MKKAVTVLLVFLAIIACNAPMAVELTTSGATAPPSATPLPSVTPVPSNTAAPSATPMPSATTVPSNTPVPTATTAPTVTPSQTSSPVPTDAAEFVMDVTIPDGTVLKPSVSFVKTWRLRNSGGTTWTKAYSLIFSSGDLMSGMAVVPLPSNVAPGGVVNVSVSLVAPANTGSYVGYWELRSTAGILFGIGANADKPFSVNIKVNSPPPPAFAVVSVVTSVSPTLYNKKCPASIKVKSVITVNGKGTVTGQWNYSTGISHDLDPLVFDAAGSQTISIVLDFNKLGPGDKYSGWVRVYIDSPNHQYFNKASFNIVCAP